MKKNNKNLILAVLIVLISVTAVYIFQKRDKISVDTPSISDGEGLDKEDSSKDESKEDIDDLKSEEDKKPEEDKKSDQENNTGNKLDPHEDGNLDLNVKSAEEIENLKKYNQPIVVQFGSSTCIYCRKMEPAMIELNGEYRGKAIVKYASLDDFPEYVQEYPVKGTPAMLYINGDGSPYVPSKKYEPIMYAFEEKDKSGHAITMSYGYMEKSDLATIIEEMLSND